MIVVKNARPCPLFSPSCHDADEHGRVLFFCISLAPLMGSGPYPAHRDPSSEGGSHVEKFELKIFRWMSLGLEIPPTLLARAVLGGELQRVDHPQHLVEIAATDPGGRC
jgi:hypothetical protein